MGFNYEKNKHNDEHGSQWTSYSDLFLGLSTVFLLLYVTTSLRTGTTGVQHQIEKERLTQQVQDLKNQLKVYNSLKKEYMEQGATKEEEEMYSQLMNKLTLLKEEAKDEKEALRQQALENENKEKALNQYQQMVRNIVNANMIAKTRIARRDKTIEQKDEQLSEQSEEINTLQADVQAKQDAIAKTEAQIAETNSKLEQRLRQLRQAYKDQNLSKKKYEEQVSKIQSEHDERVTELSQKNKEAAKKLAVLNSELNEKEGQVSTLQAKVEEKGREAESLAGKLKETEGKYASEIAKMRGEHEAQRAHDRKAFDDEMKKQKLSAAERERREAEFKDKVAKKEKDLEDRIRKTEGSLAKARAEADARRNLAKDIKKALAGAGVGAEVDAETGDVLLDFGGQYFDTGSAKLKPGMTAVIEKAMPAYTRALLENPKISKKISAVEIVGFASPTYKGRCINASSSSADDKAALKYNLDLSYQRARSVFGYVTDKMEFKNQGKLNPLMKASARSYLAEVNRNRDVAANSEACSSEQIKRAQRVLIKFALDN